jgi:hypothetical protein
LIARNLCLVGLAGFAFEALRPQPASTFVAARRSLYQARRQAFVTDALFTSTTTTSTKDTRSTTRKSNNI